MIQGNTLYGVTPGYGTAGTCYLGCGTAFKLTKHNSSWVFTPLHEFGDPPDGNFPVGMVIGPDGTLYGATLGGGTVSGGSCALGVTGCGTLFRLQPPPSFCSSVQCLWNETVLYRFTGLDGDGGAPYSGNLIFDRAANIYGTTEAGGAHTWGSVFEMNPSPGGGWTLNVIYSFSIVGEQGFGVPHTGVIMDQSGNLYGTTIWENNYADGVIYQLAPSPSGWTANVLDASHCDAMDGCEASDLSFDQQGNIFGAFGAGGPNGTGTVFKLLAAQGWSLETLYDFTSLQGTAGRLTLDAAGNLYGTGGFGTHGYGSVFKLTPSEGGYTYTDLYDFTGGADGANPYATVVLDANGNIYGTTNTAGNLQDCVGELARGCGTVWEITPQ